MPSNLWTIKKRKKRITTRTLCCVLSKSCFLKIAPSLCPVFYWHAARFLILSQASKLLHFPNKVSALNTKDVFLWETYRLSCPMLHKDENWWHLAGKHNSRMLPSSEFEACPPELFSQPLWAVIKQTPDLLWDSDRRSCATVVAAPLSFRTRQGKRTRDTSGQTETLSPSYRTKWRNWIYSVWILFIQNVCQAAPSRQFLQRSVFMTTIKFDMRDSSLLLVSLAELFMKIRND